MHPHLNKVLLVAQARLGEKRAADLFGSDPLTGVPFLKIAVATELMLARARTLDDAAGVLRAIASDLSELAEALSTPETAR